MLSSLSRIIFMVLMAVFLTACAGKGGTKPDDSGAEATVEGAADPGDVSGDQLGPTDADGQPLVSRVHFEFNSSSINDVNRETLEAHAAYLTENPDLRVKLEGHCDERGTREYNLALGEQRAKAVLRMLSVLGVDRSRMSATSYGEEKPLDEDHNESAWKQNRRVELSY